MLFSATFLKQCFLSCFLSKCLTYKTFSITCIIFNVAKLLLLTPTEIFIENHEYNEKIKLNSHINVYLLRQ